MPRMTQLDRCALSVRDRERERGLRADEALSKGYAICVRSLQRAGYLEPGGKAATRRGERRTASLRREPEAVERQRDFVRAKIEARLARASGSRSVDDFARQALRCALIRSAMEEVFSCETVWGDCRLDRPSMGHCFMASMAVQDLLGGDILQGRVRGVAHYWNRLGGGLTLDLTADQFGEPPMQLIEGDLRPHELVFRRRPGERIRGGTNEEVMRLYDRFQGRLARALRSQGLAEEAEALEQA